MEIQALFADRIGGKNFGTTERIFKFTLIENMKRDFVQANPDKVLIDMGVGEPEERASDEIVDKLYSEARLKHNRIYPCNGGADFKIAAARYLERLLAVKLDPEREIMHCMGSKNALAQIPFAFINPGDVVVGTTPAYPTFMTVSEWLGAKVIRQPLLAQNRYLPNLAELEEILKKHPVKALLLNYPNNPSGAIASAEFYKRVIELAHRYNFLLVQDAAYADYSYLGPYISPLQIPGGKQVTLELYSLSKGYNMQGFRLGFVAGAANLVKAYANVKDNTDNGQFLAIQKAGAFALDNQHGLIEHNRAKYLNRMERISEILNRFGLDVQIAAGTFYLYFKVPSQFLGQKFDLNSAECAQKFTAILIERLALVSVPWNEAGPYIRLSMTFELSEAGFKDEQAVYTALEKRLSQGKV
jgi:LL-diaminopimelate aminotransferase